MTNGITTGVTAGRTPYTTTVAAEAYLEKLRVASTAMQQCKSKDEGDMLDCAKKALKEKGLWDGDENKDIRKKFSHDGLWHRGIRGKESDMRAVARTYAVEYKQEDYLKNDRAFKKKLDNKLKEAGYTYADIIDIYNKHAGANKSIDYSSKLSELKSLRADVNENGNNVEFTEGELKYIVDEVGHREGSVHLLKTLTDAAIPGAVGAGIGALMTATAKQTATVTAAGGAKAVVKQSVSVNQALGGAVAGLTIGAGFSVYDQLTRNEEPIAVETRNLRLNTFDEYKNYAERTYGDEAPTMVNIARYFVNEDGTLQKDAMDNYLREAGGIDSVLNKKEAEVGLSNLVMKKANPADYQPEVKVVEKVVQQDCPESPAPEEITNTAPQAVTVPIAAKCPDKVIVQNGESPKSIAKRYGVDVEELKKLNQLHKFTSNCGGNTVYGFKVGQEIILPEAKDCDKVQKEVDKNKSAEHEKAFYNKKWTAAYEATKDQCLIVDGVISKR